MQKWDKRGKNLKKQEEKKRDKIGRNGKTREVTGQKTYIFIQNKII